VSPGKDLTLVLLNLSSPASLFLFFSSFFSEVRYDVKLLWAADPLEHVRPFALRPEVPSSPHPSFPRPFFFCLVPARLSIAAELCDRRPVANLNYVAVGFFNRFAVPPVLFSAFLFPRAQSFFSPFHERQIHCQEGRQLTTKSSLFPQRLFLFAMLGSTIITFPPSSPCVFFALLERLF